MDRNGIDLSSGQVHPFATAATVGDLADGGLSRRLSGQGLQDELTGVLAGDSVTTFLSFGNVSLQMKPDGTNQLVSFRGGDHAVYNPTTKLFTFTGVDGTTAIHDVRHISNTPGMPAGFLVTSVTKPNGETLTYTYVRHTTTGPDCTGPPLNPFFDPDDACQRLQAVTSNLGYMIKYQYAAPPDQPGSTTLAKVIAINLANQYCDPAAETCSDAGWSKEVFTGAAAVSGTGTAIDALNRTTTFASGSGQVTVTSPAGVAVTYSGNVQTAAGTWQYGFDRSVYVVGPAGCYGLPSGIFRFTDVTDPLTHKTTYVFDDQFGQLFRVIDPLGNVTEFTADANSRVTRVTQPECDYVNYTYDVRGNITEIRRVAKPGSSLPDKVSTAVYPASCAGIEKICNKPTSVTDNGFTTNYQYDSANGFITKVTAPAGGVGGAGARPETRYTYQALYPRHLNSQGVLVPAASQVYRLTETSTCMTEAPPTPPATACQDSANEIRTVYDYRLPGSQDLDPNLRVRSVTVKTANGSISATTDYTYDPVGNLLTADGPLNGTADTVVNRYDKERQLEGTVGPSPGGPSYGRLNLAVKYTYNPDGRQASVQRGPVNGQSDAAWAAFGPWEGDFYTYDNAGRRVVWSAFPQFVTQYAYDHHLLKCAAQRMNPAIFGSLPNDACTLGTPGPYGQDRIAHYEYDADDRQTKVTEAYATGAPRDTETKDYAANGKVAWVKDGNGNKTTYEYDKFDRLSKTFFPSKTTPGNSSTTDYVELTYDNDTWWVGVERLRDSTPVTYNYDRRGNRLSKNYPNNFIFNYGYDNLDRRTSALGGGQTLTWAYDVLGRMTSAGDSLLGTVTYEYDLAGHRTKVTWPGGGFHVVYDVDHGGFVDRIRENGATSGLGVLATYGFDLFGRRTGLNRGNGVNTAWTYETPGSRLTSLQHVFAQGNAGVTLGFAYNPARQVVSRTVDNPGYMYQPANGDRTSGVNGLNQLTTNGAESLTYDDRGNLKTRGSLTYTYDDANRLIATSDGASLQYDPIDRLRRTAKAGFVTTRFLYDGPNLIAEYDDAGTTLLERYVHGPGVDEPLTWYHGAGVGDRRWFVADNQGSIVATSQGLGGSLGSYRYDPYGQVTLDPSPVLSRFQYTGQTWIPEAGLLNYKARMYSPSLGRFMQTDPVGYGAGLNWYAYVKGDPINSVDPSGNELRFLYENGRSAAKDRDVIKSLEYLKSGSLLFGALRDQVDRSKTTYTVIVDPGGDRDGFERYEDRPNTIRWDPRSAQVLKDGRVQSPALGLGHEISHAAHKDRSPNTHMHGDEEERRATKEEGVMARELGEPVRKDYDDVSGTRQVRDPTCHNAFCQ